MLVKSARTISRELFSEKRVYICLTYDKKSVFVFVYLPFSLDVAKCVISRHEHEHSLLRGQHKTLVFIKKMGTRKILPQSP